MNAIRVIFDGKAFIPQVPITLPARSEGLVLFESDDVAAREQLDQATREYYQSYSDADDEDWARAAASESHRAWDED